MLSYGICPICGHKLYVDEYFSETDKEMTRGQLLAIMIQNFLFEDNYPISIGSIAKREGVSYYQVRKYMGILKEEGLVFEQKKYIRDGEENYLLQGWNITDKCKSLPEFKEAKEYKIAERRYEINERRKRNSRKPRL